MEDECGECGCYLDECVCCPVCRYEECQCVDDEDGPLECMCFVGPNACMIHPPRFV